MKTVIIVIIFLLFLLLVDFLLLFGCKYNLHRLWKPNLYENSTGNYPFRVNPECMRNKRIVIAGVCRNVANVIEKHIYNAEKLGGYFKDYKIVLFENDSSDATRDLIKKLAKRNKNIHLIECPEAQDCKFKEINLIQAGDRSQYRIDKMAFYRNKYMDYIQDNFNNYDYLLVQDWDIQGAIQIEPIINTICSSIDWDAIAANGKTPIVFTLGLGTRMYDTIAFCYDEKQVTDSANRIYTPFLEKLINMIQCGIDDKPVNVCSAFNGLTIYKLEKIINKRYLPNWSCEHVSINSQLEKFYIDPNLEIYIGTQSSLLQELYNKYIKN